MPHAASGEASVAATTAAVAAAAATAAAAAAAAAADAAAAAAAAACGMALGMISETAGAEQGASSVPVLAASSEASWPSPTAISTLTRFLCCETLSLFTRNRWRSGLRGLTSDDEEDPSKLLSLSSSMWSPASERSSASSSSSYESRESKSSESSPPRQIVKCRTFSARIVSKSSWTSPCFPFAAIIRSPHSNRWSG